MRIFHIVFDEKGLELFKDFVSQIHNTNCQHILMINSDSLYVRIKDIQNVELVSDFDVAAEKLILSDKVLIW